MGQFYVKLGADITQFQSKMQQATKSLEQAGKKMQNIGKSMSLYVTAPLTAIGGLALKAHADLEGVRIAFERLNQPGLLDNLRQSTSGTVSDLNLMKAAVNAKNFNIPLNQLGTLLEFAGRRAKDTGQSVDYLVESIVTGIGRKSPLILDNLGISASALKDRLGGVAVASASIGDITQVVGAIAREELNAMGEDTLTLQDQVDQLSASWQNIAGELGGIIAKGLRPLIDLLQIAVAKFKELSPAVKENVVLLAGAFAATGPILVGLGFLTTTILPAMLAGFAALTSPISLFVAGMGAVAAASIYIQENFSAISLEGGKMIATLQNKFVDLGQTIIQALKPVLDYLGYDTDGLLTMLNNMKLTIPDVSLEFKGFGQIFDETLKRIKDKVLGTSEAIAGGTPTSLDTAIKSVSNTANLAATNNATNKSKSSFSSNPNAGDPFVSLSFEKEMKTADYLFNNINEGFTNIKEHTRKANNEMGVFSGLMNDLNGQMQGILNQLMGSFGGGGGGGIFGSALGALGSTFGPIGGLVGSTVGGIIDGSVSNEPTNPYYQAGGAAGNLKSSRSSGQQTINVTGRISGDDIVFMYDDKKGEQSRYF